MRGTSGEPHILALLFKMEESAGWSASICAVLMTISQCVLAVQDFRRDNRICGQFALAWFLHNLTGKVWLHIAGRLTFVAERWRT